MPEARGVLRPAHWTALLILLVVGAGGLKDVRVSVPEAVAIGATVTLHCRYDLELDILYSVKWYKGKFEFFRYIPKELPHTRVFPLSGIDVDIGRSGPAALVLRSVGLNQTGRYRCEVSADSPTFHTAMKTSHMQVCELPDGAPELAAERMRVAAGDTLKAKCTAPPAHPPANLTWFLNGNLVNATTTEILPAEEEPQPTTTTQNPQYAYELMKETNSNSLYEGSMSIHRQPDDKIWLPDKLKPEEPTTKRRRTSTLTMVVGQESLRQGTLSLTCKASVFSLYNAQAELLLAAERPQIAPVVVLATGHTHSGVASLTISACLVIVLSTIYLKTAIR